MPDPLSLSRSDLPEEIEKAMNGAILAECKSPRICSVNGRVTKGIRCGPCERQALQAALPRLTAAEAARDAALARVERLEKALEPFAAYADHMPGQDFGEGEVGGYYHEGFRRSIRTVDLKAARSALTEARLTLPAGRAALSAGED